MIELSKPVAWTWNAYGMPHATTEEDESEELILDGIDVSPLYSQEYVSALLAELEAKDKRIAELENAPTIKHMRSVEESLIRATDMVSELEKRLATPVRLPKPCAFNLCDLVDRDAVIASLREQGFTVEGDE